MAGIHVVQIMHSVGYSALKNNSRVVITTEKYHQ